MYTHCHLRWKTSLGTQAFWPSPEKDECTELPVTGSPWGTYSALPPVGFPVERQTAKGPSLWSPEKTTCFGLSNLALLRPQIEPWTFTQTRFRLAIYHHPKITCSFSTALGTWPLSLLSFYLPTTQFNYRKDNSTPSPPDPKVGHVTSDIYIHSYIRIGLRKNSIGMKNYKIIVRNCKFNLRASRCGKSHSLLVHLIDHLNTLVTSP